MKKNLIESISKNIDDKHKGFLRTVGDVPYKISADHTLRLTEVSSALLLIVKLLKTSGVISWYEKSEAGDVNKITVGKYGLDLKVEVLTNGNEILIKTYNEMIDGDALFMQRQWCHPKNDGWDWEEFSSHLVDFIHFTMYKLQKSEEEKNQINSGGQ